MRRKIKDKIGGEIILEKIIEEPKKETPIKKKKAGNKAG